MIGRDEARELQSAALAGRLQHRDLALRARYAADGLDELALHESGALELEAESDEERRRRVQVRDGDADVVEASYVSHGDHPAPLGRASDEFSRPQPSYLQRPRRGGRMIMSVD